jgi:hypothetical protein
MHHSEMIENVGAQVTNAIETKMINNNKKNNIKKAKQSAQVIDASVQKIVASSTDQVDPCMTQLLPTKSELKDDILEEKENEIKINEPTRISHVLVPNKKKNRKKYQIVVPPPLSLEHPESDSNVCERDLKTDIDTRTVTPTTTPTTTTTSPSTTPSTIEENKVDILQQINRDRITIVQGETGCGKSSRLPVMLLEAPTIRNRPCRIMVRYLCSSAFLLLSFKHLVISEFILLQC